jgi:hypothetical protein
VWQTDIERIDIPGGNFQHTLGIRDYGNAAHSSMAPVRDRSRPREHTMKTAIAAFALPEHPADTAGRCQHRGVLR